MRPLLLLMSIAALLAAEPRPTGELVKLNGRNIHVHCAGQGETTVLLVSGIPRFSFHFALVQPEIARFTRVCSYDRAGEAWSEPLPSLSADLMLAELDSVVQHVGSGNPVVLAGHSFGGILARGYYGMRPEMVRALVLIDTPHPDMLKMPVNGQPKRMYDLTEEDMAALAEFGRQRMAQGPPPSAGDEIKPPFNRLPAELHEAHIWAMKKSAEAAAGLDPLVALTTQAAFARRLKGLRLEVPTVVITRANSADESGAWIDSQQSLAEMSPQGRLIRAVGSGHDIQLEQPEVIVSALRELQSLTARLSEASPR